MTGTFTTPSAEVTGTSTTRFSVPFSFSGMVNGYTSDPFNGPSDPVFTKSPVGGGTASATFIYYGGEGGPFFTATDLRHDFGETSPVPEPATVVLGGLGAAIPGAPGIPAVGCSRGATELSAQPAASGAPGNEPQCTAIPMLRDRCRRGLLA